MATIEFVLSYCWVVFLTIVYTEIPRCIVMEVIRCWKECVLLPLPWNTVGWNVCMHAFYPVVLLLWICALKMLARTQSNYFMLLLCLFFWKFSDKFHLPKLPGVYGQYQHYLLLDILNISKVFFLQLIVFAWITLKKILEQYSIGGIWNLTLSYNKYPLFFLVGST